MSLNQRLSIPAGADALCKAALLLAWARGVPNDGHVRGHGLTCGCDVLCILIAGKEGQSLHLLLTLPQRLDASLQGHVSRTAGYPSAQAASKTGSLVIDSQGVHAPAQRQAAAVL